MWPHQQQGGMKQSREVRKKPTDPAAFARQRADSRSSACKLPCKWGWWSCNDIKLPPSFQCSPKAREEYFTLHEHLATVLARSGIKGVVFKTRVTISSRWENTIKRKISYSASESIYFKGTIFLWYNGVTFLLGTNWASDIITTVN